MQSDVEDIKKTTLSELVNDVKRCKLMKVQDIIDIFLIHQV